MTVHASKFLSLLLRHDPQQIGLELSPQGWARISDLVRLTQGRPLSFTRESIVDIVATSDKQRFALSDDGERVRANQGHSLAVDLGLTARSPPPVLYHGTATRFLASILADGIRRGERQHVHLSADPDTATRVGQRHGAPVVLRVDAAAMVRAGSTFFLADNGVWLTEFVPTDFIATSG